VSARYFLHYGGTLRLLIKKITIAFSEKPKAKIGITIVKNPRIDTYSASHEVKASGLLVSI